MYHRKSYNKSWVKDLSLCQTKTSQEYTKTRRHRKWKTFRITFLASILRQYIYFQKSNNWNIYCYIIWLMKDKLRGNSQIKNPVVNVDPTFWGRGIKLKMYIISIAVILFQRSILQTQRKLNSFQLFPNLRRLQVSLIFK